jgi:hypothetical protein
MSTTSIDPIKLGRALAASALLFYDEGLEIVQLKHTDGPISGQEALLYEPHVVEWSSEQNCFHVQHFAASLQGNLESFLLGSPSSYIIVALCRSHEEASAVCDRLQSTRGISNSPSVEEVQA